MAFVALHSERSNSASNAPVLHPLVRHSSKQVTMEHYARMADALHEAMETLTCPGNGPVHVPPTRNPLSP
jgi:hypothetical protein